MSITGDFKNQDGYMSLSSGLDAVALGHGYGLDNFRVLFHVSVVHLRLDPAPLNSSA